jgi:hypothetical protein
MPPHFLLEMQKMLVNITTYFLRNLRMVLKLKV